MINLPEVDEYFGMHKRWFDLIDEEHDLKSFLLDSEAYLSHLEHLQRCADIIRRCKRVGIIKGVSDDD